jgi:Domain of unknown function (DUF4388)
MQNNRFVVLTGHLNDYPLSDLIGILRHQRKTGRLLIEYPQNPGIFYFQDGELVDVQLGTLTGLQAICVVVTQPASTFNFNPLIRPTRRSIDNSLQRVVSELFGCWDDSPAQIESTATNVLPDPAPIPAVEPAPERLALPPATTEILPLGFAATVTTQNRLVLGLTAAGVMMLGLSSIIAVSRSSRGRASVVEPTATLAAKPELAAEPIGDQLPTSRVEPRKPPIERTKEVKSSSEQNRHAVSSSTSSPEQNKVDTPRGTPIAAPAIQTTPAPRQEADKPAQAGSKYQMIDVVMQIEDGRVQQASISNQRSGMGAYEAMALRIARQRRYPPKTKGQETVRIRVDQPD